MRGQIVFGCLVIGAYQVPDLHRLPGGGTEKIFPKIEPEPGAGLEPATF